MKIRYELGKEDIDFLLPYYTKHIKIVTNRVLVFTLLIWLAFYGFLTYILSVYYHDNLLSDIRYDLSLLSFILLYGFNRLRLRILIYKTRMDLLKKTETQTEVYFGAEAVFENGEFVMRYQKIVRLAKTDDYLLLISGDFRFCVIPYRNIEKIADFVRFLKEKNQNLTIRL